MIAAIDLPACDPVVLAFGFTFLAGGNAARMPLFHDVVEAGIIIRELALKVVNRAFLRFVQYVISALNVAHEQIMPFVLRAVKG